MKTNRLLMTIAVLSISLLVFLIASNSTILGNEKVSELITKDLISQIGDLQEEIETLKERVSKLESGQRKSPSVPQIVHPSHPLPNVYKLPKGSVRGEVYGIPYSIIPLQHQNVDK